MEIQEGRVTTIFIVPLIQCFVGILLFIALLQSRRDLAVLALLVLGVTVGARLWSGMSLSGIAYSSLVDKEKVFPDEMLTLHIDAENKKFLPVWLQMNVSIDGSLSPLSQDSTFTNESGLWGYQRARFQWKFVARRRGIHCLGPYHIKVADPFGFFPRGREEQANLCVIVYPRLVPLKPVSLPRRDFFGAPGAKSPVQDPVYILGTRDYQQWRPARYIHWKASARHHRLQEKVFEPSEQLKILLIIEVNQFRKNNAADDFEHVLETAASLAVQCAQKGYAVGFITNGVVDGGSMIQPIAGNPQQVPAILESLARLTMKAKEELLHTLHRGLQPAWGISCMYFGYDQDATTRAVEKYFSHRKIPMEFIVCRHHPLAKNDAYKVQGKVYSLDEIRIKERERK
jgi:uncharacterized protein (DUF58 family)